ncbi:MAG: rod-binding protein [Phycisphaeraceae bacterium]
MTSDALNNLLPHAAQRPPLSEAKGGIDLPAAHGDREDQTNPAFAAALAASLGNDADEMDAAATRDAQQREQLRDAAEQLVASAFVLPFLSQVRDTSLGSDMFHGGYAEDAFQQQLDTHLADEMVTNSRFPLVDGIERYLLGERSTDMPGREVNLHG